MDWTILGIGPTDDKKAITAAYRAKLKTTNPEDKPEEFKALRKAYEEALQLADQPAAEADVSPVGRWAARVEALYNDYPARIDAERWKALLQDDVCAGLDTRPLAEEALLQFLMERYFLPREVWQILDGTFCWMERAEELCEQYPPEFVEHCVLNGIRFDQSLSYDQFRPGLDAAACDSYRQLYYRISQTPPDQREELLQQLEALPECHPYGRVLRAQQHLFREEREQAVAIFRELYEQWSGDTVLALDYAALQIQDGILDEAEPIVRRILQAEPEHVSALQVLAQCQAARGELAQAKETLYDVMNITGDDPILAEQITGQLREWNSTLIAQLEDTLGQEPENVQVALDLAWCHLQNDSLDQAMEVARTIDPDAADLFDYHNLHGKLCHRKEQYTEAAVHMEQVVSILRTMEPDGTEKTAKRIRRLPEMLQIWGNCLMQTGEKERARQAFEEAMGMAPDDPKVLTLMGNIHYAAGEFEEALAVLEHIIAVSPGSRFAYLMQALCLYRLSRDREAFDAVNRAQSFLGGDLTVYLLKMQILLRNGAFDEVHEILDFLREAGAPENLSLEFIRAQLMEAEQKDDDGAFRMYQDIARKLEAGDNLLEPGELYYRMAMVMREKMDEDSEQDRRILLDVVEKGLKLDSFHAESLRYKAWLLKAGGRLAEAIEMFRDMNTPMARRELADLYFEDQDTYGAQALAAYEELLTQRQTPELCFYAANCALNLGDHAKSEHYSRLALELDPDDIDSLRNMALLEEYRGNQEKALDYINRSAACMWDAERCYDWLIFHQVKVLSRLERPQEALDVVDDAMVRGRLNGFEMKFNICCQFGLWDQAEAVLHQWAAARRGDTEQMKAQGRLHLLRGRMLKATFAYGRSKHHMTREEQLDLRIQLGELEANHKRVMELLRQKLEQGGDQSQILTTLALTFRWAGAEETARELAARGLQIVDQMLGRYQSDEPLYRTRRSLLLALLGRMDEARAELTLARKLPLCRQCTYCTCKDADIYEGYLEEIAGNREKARALYLAGQKNWPDELDFHAGLTRLKKNKKG